MKKKISLVLILTLLTMSYAFANVNISGRNSEELKIMQTKENLKNNFSEILKNHYKKSDLGLEKLRNNPNSKFREIILIDNTKNHNIIEDSFEKPQLIYESIITVSSESILSSRSTPEINTEITSKISSYTFKGSTITYSTQLTYDWYHKDGDDPGEIWVKMKTTKYYWSTDNPLTPVLEGGYVPSYDYLYAQSSPGYLNFSGTKYFDSTKSSGGHTTYVFPDYSKIIGQIGVCYTTCEYNMSFIYYENFERKDYNYSPQPHTLGINVYMGTK